MARLGLAPRNLEVVPISAGYFACAHNYETPKRPISEHVATGFSRSAELATLKALTEWLERIAVYEAVTSGEHKHDLSRSDGAAGYPVAMLGRKIAAQRARNNAHLEAMERFAWSRWWDDSSVSHSRRSIASAGLRSTTLLLLRECCDLLRVRDFEVVIPAISGGGGAQLLILLARLDQGGVVTGGAAGRPANETTWIRAASELLRHCLAIARMRTEEFEASTLYERRLAFFGTGEGSSLVEARLSNKGRQRVCLPLLELDEEIKYSASHVVYVHRCLFLGQPEFMGGSVERLCI